MLLVADALKHQDPEAPPLDVGLASWCGWQPQQCRDSSSSAGRSTQGLACLLCTGLLRPKHFLYLHSFQHLSHQHICFSAVAVCDPCQQSDPAEKAA